MSLKSRMREMRSYFIGGLISSSHEAATVLSARGPTAAKVIINEDIALNYSAVWAAINLIAGDVATTPCNLMKRRAGLGKDVYDDHYLYELLHDQPNPEMSIVDLIESIVAHALSWGNGYAEIERDRLNRAVALWLITPDRVTPFRSPQYDSTKGAMTLGPLQYRVDGKDTIPAGNMIHIHGLGWDGNRGYSVIDRARESIAMAIAAERFGGTFFGNGTNMGGVLNVDADVDPEQMKGITDAIEKMHQGADKAHQILVVPGGQKFDKLNIPPDEAQFLESRKFQVTEIARWYGVPPHKIGDLEKATFTNIEQQDLDYYKRTLRRWYVRLEKEFSRKLVAPAERFQQFFKFNADAFLRGDIASRYAAFGIARDKGVLSANEWRDLEDQNPQPGTQGDIYLVQQAMVPLDRMNDLVDATISAKTQPKAAPAPKALPAAPVDGGSPAARDDMERQIIELRERILDLERDLAHATGRTEEQASHIVTLDRQARALQAEVEDARQQIEAERAKKVDPNPELVRHLSEAQEKLQDITGELATAIAQREASQIEATRTSEELREVREAIVDARQRVTREMTTLEDHLRATERETIVAQERAAEASRDLAAAAARSDASEGEIQRLTGALHDAQGHLAAAEAAHQDEIRKQGASFEERLARTERMLLEAQEKITEAQTEMVIVSARCEAGDAEVLRSEAALKEAISQFSALQVLADTLREKIEGVGEDRRDFEMLTNLIEQATKDSATARTEVARATAAEREAREEAEAIRTRLTAMEQSIGRTAEERTAQDAEQARLSADLQARDTDLATRQAATEALALNLQRSERELAQTQDSLARSQADLQNAFRDRKERDAGLALAIQAIVLDVERRMLNREIEGITRMQSSPDKMRSKLDTFYSGHAAVMVKALGGAMRAHLAFLESSESSDAKTEALVERHIMQSRAEINAVLDGEAVEFGTSITAMLHRWDADGVRAGRISEALMAEAFTLIPQPHDPARQFVAPVSLPQVPATDQEPSRKRTVKTVQRDEKNRITGVIIEEEKS